MTSVINFDHSIQPMNSGKGPGIYGLGYQTVMGCEVNSKSAIESVFGPDLRVIKVCLVTYLPTFPWQCFNEGKPDTILAWDIAYRYRFLSLRVQESEQVSQRLSTSGTYTARLHSDKTLAKKEKKTLLALLDI